MLAVGWTGEEGPVSEQGMVGRSDDLRVVHTLVDAVARGRRRRLVVRGEPGIGKTSLLTVLGDAAAARGFTVLRGRATELESDVPLAAVLEALADTVDQSSLEADGPEPAPAATRWRVYRSVVDHLQHLAARSPVALVVDDVHWADPATLELLEHLVRRPPHAPHLLALGLRPGGAADRLIVAMRAQGVGTVMDVGPLSRDDAEPLMASFADAGDRDRLYREAGGNPMLIEELVRAGSAEGVPGGVRALVRDPGRGGSRGWTRPAQGRSRPG